MIICKKLNPTDTITSIEEWFLKCPPQGKEKHWVDGRSAKETAKHWLKGIPDEFLNILSCFSWDLELCSPELVTKFDSYPGNGRNHDLLILAKDSLKEKVVISIESKVDESYGQTIGPYLGTINQRKESGKNSNADRRIEDLRNAIFPNVDNAVFESFKYQLLTAVAGTLTEAKKQGAKKAIFLVQTLVTSNMNERKNRKNQSDLDHFMEVISEGEHRIIRDNDLFGPFKFLGNAFIPDDVELWIGKYSIEI